jgi:hypothetical protein
VERDAHFAQYLPGKIPLSWLVRVFRRKKLKMSYRFCDIFIDY